MTKRELKAEVARLTERNEFLERKLFESILLGSAVAEVAGRELGLDGATVIQTVAASERFASATGIK